MPEPTHNEQKQTRGRRQTHKRAAFVLTPAKNAKKNIKRHHTEKSLPMDEDEDTSVCTTQSQGRVKTSKENGSCELAHQQNTVNSGM